MQVFMHPLSFSHEKNDGCRIDTGMRTFWEWLLQEDRRSVEPAVLAAYEHAFKDELRRVIQRTGSPVLRKELLAMLDCPIRTPKGCMRFTDYIVGTLIKNGVQHVAVLEAALGYVAEKMLLPTTDAGESRV